MPTQCDTKPLEFEGHGRRRLVAKKLFFLEHDINMFFFLNGNARI